MLLRDYILSGKARLIEAKLQCADPLQHMKQIVELALDWSPTQLHLAWDEPLTPDDIQKSETVLSRRLTGEPFQYIAGYEYFWKSKFKVGPGVLIPRRETEQVLEAALKALPVCAKIAELGAGSGNLGLSALFERPEWEWHAFELNPETLPYTEFNRSLLPSSASYHLHHEDFFVGAKAFAPFTAIVANPPYVSSSEMRELPKEVRHEPTLALEAGEKGLDVLIQLVAAAPSLIDDNGYFFSEIGSGQEEAMKHLLANVFASYGVLSDYAGLPRIAWGKKG